LIIEVIRVSANIVVICEFMITSVVNGLLILENRWNTCLTMVSSLYYECTDLCSVC